MKFKQLLVSMVLAAVVAGLNAKDVLDMELANEALGKGVKIAVWPEGKIPLSGAGAPYRVHDTNGGIVRLTDVTVPELAYFPSAGEGVKPAVLVCPGGGYTILAYNHEGTEIAEWLNSLGFSAFVLKYRCPGQRDAAHMDAQRALSLIRFRAEEFSIDPKRIGVMGFSAGANLSVRLSTNWRNRAYPTVDEIDAVSCRPDFTLPIYPWMLVVGSNDEKTLPLILRGEFAVDSETPPAFLVQTEDDFAHIENSLAYYAALKYAGVPAEMHLFTRGGHGYGIRRHDTPVDGWEELAAKWLKSTWLK